MKKRIKGRIVLLLVLILCGMGRWSAVAADTGLLIPEGFFEAADGLNSEDGVELPDGLDGQDPEEVEKAVMELTDPSYLLRTVLGAFQSKAGSALRLLATLCGLLLLSAVFGAVRSSLGLDGTATVFRFCGTSAILAAILAVQIEHLGEVSRFFERLTGLMEAMIPVLGSLWAMGGNVTTAAAGTGTLYVFLTVTERICAVSVIPVCVFCSSLALCGALTPEVGVRGLSGAVKKIYTFSLGLVMTLLLFSLSSQTALSAAADSVTARAARTVSSSVIPIVGGAVGETLRVLASSVQYIKSVVGFGGVIFVLLLLLPCLVSLLLSRLALLLATGVAELLGCDHEGRLLGDLGGIYGLLVAVVSMCSVMFMLALTLFVRTAVAVG